MFDLKKSTPQMNVFEKRTRRRNVRALLQLLGIVGAMVLFYSTVFHLIMHQVEGQRHSLVTGLYWTLSTMTTLGLGDVVFRSDLGKVFTLVVLCSGILTLFILLPFAFIRYFYVPWIATQRISDKIAGHVIITNFDNMAPALIEQLELHEIPYFVLEPDPARAQSLHDDGITVAVGTVDDKATYERLRVAAAGLVLANNEDTTNTNVTLTVREAAPAVALAALADEEASIDILALAGATRVLALKQQLGEQLANRLNAGHAQVHVIGTFRDQVIGEFPVHNTPFVGRTIRDIKLREAVGVNIIGVLEHTRFVPPHPEVRLVDHSVLLVVGTALQMEQLDEYLVIYDANYSPALVIGGGKVGRAATTMLRRKGVPVNLIEKDVQQAERIRNVADRLVVGDAAELEVIRGAGLDAAPGVVISTRDDAMNIYLTVYCRRLAPDIRIVSRITHERNMEAIRRAGADLALSHISLGVQSVFAMLRGEQLVVLGEGIELHELPTPASLAGRTLGEAAIGSRTGLNVIAIQEPEHAITTPVASTKLEPASRLVMIGGRAQLEKFIETYD